MATFPMRGYKIDISNKFKNNDFNFGINPEDNKLSDELVEKINNGLLEWGVPWKVECIPYYKNAFFVWYNKQAFESFLFMYCNLNEDDINELISNGYKLYTFTVNAISRGLSNCRGTCFEDEVEDIEEIDFSSLNKNVKTKYKNLKTCNDNNIHYYKGVNIYFKK